MHLTLVSTASSPTRPAGGPAPRGHGFEELLAGFAAGQVAATAGLATSANNLALAPAKQSARQARIEEQTADHRRKAADRAATRGADPSSVERGVVSARRERILAQRAESGSQVQAREVKTTDEKIAADRPPQAQPKGHSRFPESDRPRSVDLAESSVRPAAEALKSDAKPSAPEPGAIKASALPAAESAPAARVVADAIRGPTPAEALGRVLAGRPAESVGRVAAASPATAGGEAGQRQAGTASRTAERSAPNKNSESAERGDSARRADFARLVRSLKVQAGAKSSSAVIRLDPPELGRVRINVRMEENALSVRVEAATAKGRELLQSRIRELVDSLAEHNIRVDRLEVVAAEDGSGLSGSHGNPSGSAPMEGMGANANREDRRSDRREGEESVETLEDETLAAALDSRLDIRV